jgi:hypothetical protein
LADGLALFAATIQHLLQKKNECPKTLLCTKCLNFVFANSTVTATHFTEIFEYELIKHDSNLQLMKMDYLVSGLQGVFVNCFVWQTSVDGFLGDLVFLYKFVQSQTEHSVTSSLFQANTRSCCNKFWNILCKASRHSL